MKRSNAIQHSRAAASLTGIHVWNQNKAIYHEVFHAKHMGYSYDIGVIHQHHEEIRCLVNFLIVASIFYNWGKWKVEGSMLDIDVNKW
jgi:hypothetical protein